MLANIVATSATLGTAGTTSAIVISAATAMGGTAADNIMIRNRGTVGTLLVAFSNDASNYTSGVYVVASNAEAVIRDVSVKAVKLDGSQDNVTYSLVAWRSALRSN